MAVTVNGSVTNHNISATIGSGVASTFAYTCPTSTTLLAVIEMAVSAAPAVPTALSYNSVALTNVASSFISNNAGDQGSIWYLNAPTTGSSLTFSITYSNSITGGGGVMLIPLLGTDASAFVGTAAHNFSNALVTSGSLSVTAATANDLIIAGLTLDGGAGVPTATDGQTNLINAVSRGSVRLLVSSSPGNVGSLSWSAFSVANAYTATGVAFLAPSGNPTISPNVGAGVLTGLAPASVQGTILQPSTA